MAALPRPGNVMRERIIYLFGMRAVYFECTATSYLVKKCFCKIYWSVAFVPLFICHTIFVQLSSDRSEYLFDRPRIAMLNFGEDLNIKIQDIKIQ